MSDVRIIKCGPGALSMLKDLFLEDPSYSRAGWVEQVRSWMVDFPNNVLVLAAVMADGASGKVIAYSVTTAEDQAKFAFVHQVWASAEAGRVADQLLFKTAMWAEDMGKIELRAESARTPEALLRKYRFEQVSAIFAFAIPDTLRAFETSGQRSDLLGAKQEPDDGRRQQFPQDDVDADHPATAGGAGCGDPDPAGVGGRSDAVHGG